MNSLLILIIPAAVFSAIQCAPPLNPVVLVPGDGGSQFQAKLNKPTTVEPYCLKKTSYYYDLWLNLEQLVPFLIDCFVDNMRLVYDNVTRTTHNSPGVDIVIPGFGDTATVEWLDHSQLSLTTYFHTIVNAMEAWGYKRNVSVRGAPYDFRKAPNEMQSFLANLKTLIEETYYMNKNTKVVLIAHSMGNPTALYLLNKMSKSWKAKFIHSMICLAGVWGGAMKPVKLMISGDNLHVPTVKSLSVRIEQRSMPSTAWLMPSEEFWGPKEILVSSPSKNYTVKDYKQFFEDINYTTGYNMWEDTNRLIKPLTAPGVVVHCLHGYNVSTLGTLVYTNKTWSSSGAPTTPGDDGDGTVNLRSLCGCLRFRKQQSQPVYHQVFKGAEHLEVLNLPGIVEYIKTVLLGHNSTSQEPLFSDTLCDKFL